MSPAEQATIAAYLAPEATMTAKECLAALGIEYRRVRSPAGYEYTRGGVVVHRGTVFTLTSWLRAGMPALEVQS